MKITILVVVLAFMISLAGDASTICSVEKGQTENLMISKTIVSSTMKSEKAKKVHHKKHKSASGSKKSK